MKRIMAIAWQLLAIVQQSTSWFVLQIDYELWATADHNYSSSFTSSWQVLVGLKEGMPAQSSNNVAALLVPAAD